MPCFVRFVQIVILVYIILLCIAILRTFLIDKPPPPFTAADVDVISERRGLSNRLGEAIRFQTVTEDVGHSNLEQIDKFIDFINNSFPKVHSSSFILRERINNLSLLYTVRGRHSDLKPYLLASHLDVVPADASKWKFPPFSGKNDGGYIYGRGTIDAKHIVMGTLEALEYMLEYGFAPRRTFYLAFGHDEEAGGLNGARHISETLKSRGVQLEFLLDEGSFVMNNSFPGVHIPIALVSVAEKGFLSLKLSVNGTAGHSSMPPQITSIVALAKAVSKFDGKIFPSLIGKGPEAETLKILAPYASFPFKILYGNLWLFKPILSWFFGRKTHTDSLVRTTTAVTVIRGGIKSNVIPGEASAIINHRIHPLHSVNEVLKFDLSLIDDTDVHVEILSAHEPHPVSPYDDESFGFMTIKKSIRQIFPECAVVPFLMIGNTDTKWYLNLTKSIYRFSPINLLPSDLSRFHGDNERILIKNYEQTVNFYYQLILNSDSAKLDPLHTHGGEL